MIFSHRLTAGQATREPESYTPLWFRVSSLVLLLVAVALLIVVLGHSVYRANLALAALGAVLLALGCAALLHARAWYDERQSIYATEREFTSVFQHALDGILILDDRGVCLDANPAAFALLGAPPAMLIGHPVAQFYERRDEFEQLWRSFLERSYQRGQAQLVRANGLRVFVHYTAAANYLPGRHVFILCDVTERIAAETSLREAEERLHLMADNISEIVWMMDGSTKEVLYVNRAYESITGRSRESLYESPLSYSALIHPTDRTRVLAKLEEASRCGQLDQEFRIVRPDHTVRWVSVKASTVPEGKNVPHSLVGTVQDITARKLAEAQVAEHLAAAEASRAEAEALRKATLSLTQNLRMDAVLDTLLRCLLEIVPYHTASVLLSENDGRLFVAREAPPSSPNRPVVTLELDQNAFLERVLLLKKAVHLPDTCAESDWRDSRALGNVRCWIAVPLVASDMVLGLLSIGHAEPGALTVEHLRLAKSLAVPAAVAIHNARLYEWAEIYAAERKDLLKKIHESPKAM